MCQLKKLLFCPIFFFNFRKFFSLVGLLNGHIRRHRFISFFLKATKSDHATLAALSSVSKREARFALSALVEKASCAAILLIQFLLFVSNFTSLMNGWLYLSLVTYRQVKFDNWRWRNLVAIIINWSCNPTHISIWSSSFAPLSTMGLRLNFLRYILRYLHLTMLWFDSFYILRL